MGLFSRDPKKAWGKKLGEAQEARDNEDYGYALTLYDELIPEAEELFGAEDIATLATRVARAEARLENGDAEQARDELLPLVDQLTESLGPSDDFALDTRGQLAVAHGQNGEHAKAAATFAAALADAERDLGPDTEQAIWLRRNLQTAEELASVVELDRLLLLSPDPAAQPASEKEWKSRLERARTGRPGTYRSKATWSYAEQDLSGELEWVIESTTPDRFHVRQTARSAAEDLYDEWIKIGDRNYSFTGHWLDNSAVDEARVGNADATRALELERCLEFLRSEVPDAARAASSPEGFLELHYINGNLARRRMTDSAPTSSDRGTTVIWLDKDDLVVKAASTFGGTIEGSDVQAKLEQAFTAYNERISIEAPEVIATLDADGTAELDPDALPAGALD
jgi:hypothetical protein